MEQRIFLNDLPVEILLKAFCFCDLPSLSCLSQTCQKFASLCADEILWRKLNRKLFLPICGPSLGCSSTERIAAVWRSLPAKKQANLIANCKSKAVQQRHPTPLSARSSRSVHRTLFAPPQAAHWMHRVLLDDRGVWSASSDAVFRFPWHFRGGTELTLDPEHVQVFERGPGTDGVVGDFTMNEQYLVSGHWDGSVTVREIASDSGGILFTIRPHLSEVESVALRGCLLVSGSKDHTVSFNNIAEQRLLSLVNFDDLIWSVAINPSQSVVAIGTTGTTRHPTVKVSYPNGSGAVKQLPAVEQGNLRLYDFEKEVLVANLKQNFKHGFGTLATQFLDDQMLVSGGHDGVLRYWDLRQNKCAQELDSELDYAVYCFTTDGQHTVLTGYANYNTVCYFDRRFPRYAIKTKSFDQERQAASASRSVYGLAFSPFELYVGLDDGLYKVDFCS